MVYRLPSPDTPDGRLGLHVAEKTKLIATFRLPALMMGVGSTVYIHNNASVVHSNPGNPSPFHILPHRRVLKIEWVTFGRNERRGTDGINGLTLQSPVFGRVHYIYVHSDIFLRDPDFYPEVPIPWHRWGPRNSRMISASNELHSRSSFGARHVQLSGSVVEVRDFAKTQPIWEDQYIRPDNAKLVESRMVDRSSPAEFDGPLIYQDGVVRTSLPYLHLTQNLGLASSEFHPRGVMCDDEHIILVQVISLGFFIFVSYHLALQGPGQGSEGHQKDAEITILTM